MEYWTGERIISLAFNEIFVFGSNPEGRHGMGAAKSAMAFGAKYGIGRGRMWQTYALVTKNLKAGYTEKASGITYKLAGKNSVSNDLIIENIKELYKDALENLGLRYFIPYKYTNTTSNLCGISTSNMIDLFKQAGEIPTNIMFHESCSVLFN